MTVESCFWTCFDYQNQIMKQISFVWKNRILKGTRNVCVIGFCSLFRKEYCGFGGMEAQAVIKRGPEISR